MRRLTSGRFCPDCERQHQEQRDQARSEFQGALDNIAKGEAEPSQAVALIEKVASTADMSEDEQSKLREQAFIGYAETALADDILTAEEEDRFVKTGEALGITQETLDEKYGNILDRLVVGQVNDGRLPEVVPSFMTKRNEVVHIEVPAAKMKEVTVRERHGGATYGGFSFRIAKGVRFSTGKIYPPRTATHKETQVEDIGTLAITSQRVVFLGQGGTTVEMPYSKLINLSLFNDGLQFHQSNRKKAPMFQIGASVDPVAAIINAAAQRAES